MTDNNGLAPNVYHILIPLLKVKERTKFIEFLKQVFGAKEINRYQQKERESVRIDVKIGESVIMISDFIPELNPMSSAFYLYVDDTDTIYKRALEHGATSLREPRDEIYGDRCAGIKDPFGNLWVIASYKKVPGENYGYDSNTYADTDQTFSI